MTRPDLPLSFEFFPAKSPSAQSALMTAAYALGRFGASFQTVTFGADGGERHASSDWCRTLADLREVPTACHLTLCAFDRDGLFEFTDGLWAQGTRRLVLLRGDAVKDGEDGLASFSSVAEALGALKRRRPFDISVAAYPETHPKAVSADADLRVLLEKQQQGADRAITQFFFNTSDFLRFRDRATHSGLTLPLIAGVMPIANAKRTFGFADKCGAAVPERLRQRFDQAADDKAEQGKIAKDFARSQIADLLREGVDGIHIYTMNRPELAADAARAVRQFEMAEIAA